MADVIPILAAEHLSLQMPSKKVSRCFPHLLTHPVLFVFTADQSQDNENLTLSISETELQTCQDSPKTTAQVTTQNNNSAPSEQESGLVGQQLPKRCVCFHICSLSLTSDIREQ